MNRFFIMIYTYIVILFLDLVNNVKEYFNLDHPHILDDYEGEEATISEESIHYEKVVNARLFYKSKYDD